MQNVRTKSFLSWDVFGQNCRELSLCLPLQFYKQFPDQIKKTWVFCHLVNECHIYLHNSETFGKLDWVVLCPKRLLFSITMLPCELQCQTATLQAVELLGKFMNFFSLSWYQLLEVHLTTNLSHRNRE